MKWLSCFLCTPALAMNLTVVAEVERDGRADDRVVDIQLVIAAADGSLSDVTCDSRDAPLQGTLVVECEVADAMAGAPLVASLSLDGLPSWSGDVPTPVRVAVAERAESAFSADNATNISNGNLIPRTSVTGGSVGFASANLVGLPADVADGVDQGNLQTVQGPLALSNGTLVVGLLQASNIAANAITGSKWAAGTIRSVHIRAATFDGSDLVDLVNADFANATLSRANDFAAGQFTTAVRQLNIGCNELTIRPLTTAASCLQIRGGCAAGQLRACNTGTCLTDAVVSTCTNTTPGQLLIP
jgi:hypothetical protein